MKNNWLNKQEYPFASKWFDVNGHKLHYVDEGKGETILFVHGTPSWSFEYRHLIKAFSPTCRCVAPDHIGFGLSEKPVAYDYSTLNHSRTLEHLVLSLGLNDITLVVHDFGGPIGLNVAIKHPGLIKRIVILNSWLWDSSTDPEFIKLSRILRSPLLPFLYRYLNFSARYLLPKSFGEQPLGKKLLKQYTKPFSSASEREGPLAFARSLLNDQEWFGELWSNRERINTKPALLVWGMKDKVLKPAMLDRFANGFAGAKVVKLETCGHFPQEEQAQDVVKALREFLDI
jgi:pimeloyl-ACP methyl ester carboxylesterase